jgi:hypothetical protein
MIDQTVNYGVHANLAGHIAMVTIGRYSWKAITQVATGDVTFVDAVTYTPVPLEQAMLVKDITEVADKYGIRVLNNNMGDMSMMLFNDDPQVGVEFWYHMNRETGAISMRTNHVKWDDVNDMVELATGMLMSIDPASAAKTAEVADSEIAPMVQELLVVTQSGEQMKFDSIRP